MGGTYRKVGDYLIPNLTLPPEDDTRPIGILGCGSPVETVENSFSTAPTEPAGETKTQSFS